MWARLLLISTIILTIFVCGCESADITDGENIGANITGSAIEAPPPEDLPVITDKDLMLRDIQLGINENEFKHLITSSITDESINDEYEGHFLEKTYVLSDGLKAVFTDFHDNRGFILFSLSTTSESYATPRGLYVGDSVDKVIELYGVPVLGTYNNDFDYGDENGEYIQLRVTVSNDKVVEISIWLLM